MVSGKLFSKIIEFCHFSFSTALIACICGIIGLLIGNRTLILVCFICALIVLIISIIFLIVYMIYFAACGSDHHDDDDDDNFFTGHKCKHSAWVNQKLFFFHFICKTKIIKFFLKNFFLLLIAYCLAYHSNLVVGFGVRLF